MGLEDTAVEVIKWIRESVRPVYVIFVLSGFCLLPSRWLAGIGISDWTSAHHPLMVLSFLGSIVWLSSFQIEKWYWRAKGKSYLNDLTDEEKGILKTFILNAKKTQAFVMGLGTARHLAQQRLLIETPTPDARGHTVFTMDSWIFSYLRNRPELVGMPKNLS